MIGVRGIYFAPPGSCCPDDDAMNPALSVIVPAYDEAHRLPAHLLACKHHLDHELPGDYEVIVVNDGSKDDLGSILEKTRLGWCQLRHVRHTFNQGKGTAIRSGILSSRGRAILFCDADGACPIEHELTLRKELEFGADLAVGSRAVGGIGYVKHRLWYRSFLGKTFGFITRRLLGLTVRDTQCGFKMFRREAAVRLGELCCEPGYLFDVELLCWAKWLGYRFVEVPVSWRDVPGSKVRLLRDGAKMLCGLWRLQRRF